MGKSPRGKTGAGRALPPAGVRSGRVSWDVQLLLVGCVAIAFFPVLSADFVNLDDGLFLHENYLTRDLSARNVARAFTTTTGPNYVPLVIVSFAAERAVWGLHPQGFHAVNLALHVLSALLALRILLGLGAPRWPAVAAAAIWAVHPLRVESVAWIAERKDCLCTFFALAAIFAYQRSFRSSSRQWYALSVVAHLLAMLSKGMAVTVPLLLLLLDWFEGRRNWKSLVLNKTPFFAASVLCALPTLVAHLRTGTAGGRALSAGQRIALAAYSITFNTWRQVLPIDLSPAYDLPDPLALGNFTYAASLFFCVGIVLLLVVLRKSRAVVFGVSFYLIALVPVSQIIPLRYEVADRYTYLPSMGLAFLLCVLIQKLERTARVVSWRNAIRAAVAAVLLVCAVGAYTRAHDWRSSHALWTDARLKQPHNATVLRCLGNYWRSREKYDLAERYYREAMRSERDKGVVLRELAALYLNTDRPEAALECIEQVGPRSEDDLQGWELLATCYVEVGRVQEGNEAFRKLQERFPDVPGPWHLHGVALARRGLYSQALPSLRRASILDPSNPETGRWLKEALAATGSDGMRQ